MLSDICLDIVDSNPSLLNVAKLSCLNIEVGDPVRGAGALFKDGSTGGCVLLCGNTNEPNGELDDDDGEKDVGSCFDLGFGCGIKFTLRSELTPSLFSNASWIPANPSYGYSDNPDLLGI